MGGGTPIPLPLCYGVRPISPPRPLDSSKGEGGMDFHVPMELDPPPLVLVLVLVERSSPVHLALPELFGPEGAVHGSSSSSSYTGRS